ncbi:hypothetical protein ACFLZN_02690 [Nanoarchaeota archaeon]
MVARDGMDVTYAQLMDIKDGKTVYVEYENKYSILNKNYVDYRDSIDFEDTTEIAYIMGDRVKVIYAVVMPDIDVEQQLCIKEGGTFNDCGVQPQNKYIVEGEEFIFTAPGEKASGKWNLEVDDIYAGDTLPSDVTLKLSDEYRSRNINVDLSEIDIPEFTHIDLGSYKIPQYNLNNKGKAQATYMVFISGKGCPKKSE